MFTKYKYIVVNKNDSIIGGGHDTFTSEYDAITAAKRFVQFRHLNNCIIKVYANSGTDWVTVKVINDIE